MSFIAAPKLKVVCYGAGLPLVTSTTDGSEQQILADSLPSSLEPHSPSAFYQDREGILWIGTNAAGLWRIRRQVVVTPPPGRDCVITTYIPFIRTTLAPFGWAGRHPQSLR